MPLRRGATGSSGPVGPEEGTSVSSDRAPGGLLRQVLPPLLLDHVLILVGAWLLVSSFEAHRTMGVAAGAGVLASGIIIELVVLVWSATLVRAAARTLAPSVSGPDIGRFRQRSRCTSCGWSGVVRVGSLCPRCARTVLPAP